MRAFLLTEPATPVSPQGPDTACTSPASQLLRVCSHVGQEKSEQGRWERRGCAFPVSFTVCSQQALFSLRRSYGLSYISTFAKGNNAKMPFKGEVSFGSLPSEIGEPHGRGGEKIVGVIGGGGYQENMVHRIS